MPISNTDLTKNKQLSRIVLTPGEPAGIGADLIIDLINTFSQAEIIACCDPDLLLQRARALGKNISVEIFEENSPARLNPADTIKVLPVSLVTTAIPGQLDVSNAQYVLNCLREACQGCVNGRFDAMVTGPVQKSIINDAGILFSGHTEFLAEECANAYPVMMLANPELRVALLTTHIPLAKVSQSIDQANLEKTLKIIHNDLKQHFNIQQPAIYVCGLNPHAGEGGHLGLEEKTIIEPVLQDLKKKGMNLIGPLPADTIFTKDHLQNADVIVAMYHDQGLPTLKALGFGETVNVTLGLPIIRTSVDHGTALELAGSGKAHAGSLSAAINMAIDLVHNKRANMKNSTHQNDISQ